MGEEDQRKAEEKAGGQAEPSGAEARAETPMRGDGARGGNTVSAEKQPKIEEKKHAPRVWRSFAWGLALTAVLTFGKWELEHYELGRQIEQMTVNLLQLRLGEKTDWAKLPVRVVDITGLVPVRMERGGEAELVTPRAELREIVKQIAAAGPLAIGIDVDFSPSDAGYVTKDDPEALREFAGLKDAAGKRVRAFVGIYSAAKYEREHRLIDPEFAGLAACILVPNPDRREPVTRMVLEMRLAGAAAPCPSMATALARTVRAQEEIQSPAGAEGTRDAQRKNGEWLSENFPFLLRKTQAVEKELVTAETFAIDFGPLEQLMEKRMVVNTAADIAGKEGELRGRVVLVGRGTTGRTMDQFNVPAQPHPVPGVFVHAVAAYTLLEAPLYELTHLGRIVMDVAAALVLLLLVAGLRVLVYRWTGRDPATGWASFVFLVAVSAGIFGLGYLWIDEVGILWTDYLVVIAVLWIHWLLEMFFHSRKKGHGLQEKPAV